MESKVITSNLLVALVTAGAIYAYADFMDYFVRDEVLTFVCIFISCFVLRLFLFKLSAGAVVGCALAFSAPWSVWWEWILGFVVGGVIDIAVTFAVGLLLVKLLEPR